MQEVGSGLSDVCRWVHFRLCTKHWDEVMNRILSAYLWVICAHLELLVFSPPINIGISHKHRSHKCWPPASWLLHVGEMIFYMREYSAASHRCVCSIIPVTWRLSSYRMLPCSSGLLPRPTRSYSSPSQVMTVVCLLQFFPLLVHCRITLERAGNGFVITTLENIGQALHHSNDNRNDYWCTWMFYKRVIHLQML